MQDHSPDRIERFRTLVQGFLEQRRDEKLKKLEPDSSDWQRVQERFLPTVWFEDASRRAAQIQVVTHSAKGVHPQADATSLYCEPIGLPRLDALGTHALGRAFDRDVVGNAAALDVYAFLRLELDGISILHMAVSNDDDLAAALSDDPATSGRWMQAFAGLLRSPGKARSHELLKQVYWPVTSQADGSTAYHLLAPLYPSSLVHRVYLSIREHLFGEVAKGARGAKRDGKWHDDPVLDYPDLAIVSMGGSKPQNVGVLNNARSGVNYRLASLPPAWRSPAVSPIYGMKSLFDSYARLSTVRREVTQLLRLLKSDPKPVKTTRDSREDHVEALLDELVQFIARIRELEPGWSQHADCKLGPIHQLWLDPEGAEASPVHVPDTADSIAHDFALWLNGQLWKALPVGDVEYQHWKNMALQSLVPMTPEPA